MLGVGSWSQQMQKPLDAEWVSCILRASQAVNSNGKDCLKKNVYVTESLGCVCVCVYI